MAQAANENGSDTATTTTTTVAENTTTSTTTNLNADTETTTSTTVDAAAAEHNAAEKHGEVAVDPGERAQTTNDVEQTPEERGDEARAQAMQNHATEHAHDDDETRHA